MGMRNVETRGLVLFNRHYKERDLLVKIFTESFGKRMFFVKNASRSRFASSLQPFTLATFDATINDDGFSFINDIGATNPLSNLTNDLLLNAHASVVVSLSDEALPDAEYDPALYGFLTQTLQLMDDGLDSEILMDIFELQLLARFGVSLNFTECALCGRHDLPMDFSVKFDGCLCTNHFIQDSKREHLDPNTLVFAGQFQEIPLTNLRTISVKSDSKQKLQTFITFLYEHYTGVHTRAQKFLESLRGFPTLEGN